jgi:hypothetical protein
MTSARRKRENSIGFHHGQSIGKARARTDALLDAAGAVFPHGLEIAGLRAAPVHDWMGTWQLVAVT